MIFSQEAVDAIQSGELAIIPTDTLYGIVCQAGSAEAVGKLYLARGRDRDKPCITLLSDISELSMFGIELSDTDRESLQKVWPGKVSVVFGRSGSVQSLEKWAYLHRGTKTLAFRVPDDAGLLELLRQTGPLLAPSANIQGKDPAHTVAEAKEYFADSVAIYVDGGYRDSLPSTVARLSGGGWQTLREGAVKL